MPLAHHEIAYAVIVLAFCAALVIPLIISYRWGWKIGLAAALGWALSGFAVFHGVEPSLGVSDSIGVAIVGFLVPWLLAVLIGVSLRRGRAATRTARD
ncbi:MAG: hypothetical protein ABR583_07110 [Gaiellaceae bacterium]